MCIRDSPHTWARVNTILKAAGTTTGGPTVRPRGPKENQREPKESPKLSTKRTASFIAEMTSRPKRNKLNNWENRITRRAKTATFRLTCCKTWNADKYLPIDKTGRLKKITQSNKKNETPRDAFETIKTYVFWESHKNDVWKNTFPRSVKSENTVQARD